MGAAFQTAQIDFQAIEKELAARFLYRSVCDPEDGRRLSG
jgi:hypothetical protein